MIVRLPAAPETAPTPVHASASESAEARETSGMGTPQSGSHMSQGALAAVLLIVALILLGLFLGGLWWWYKRRTRRAGESRLMQPLGAESSHSLLISSRPTSMVPQPAGASRNMQRTPSATSRIISAFSAGPRSSVQLQSAATSNTPRSRPVLQLVTRSESAASHMSTEIVVEHAEDIGQYDTDMYLPREERDPRAPRIPSKRNAEGRRVVHEIIPPKYNPGWREEDEEGDEEYRGGDWGMSPESQPLRSDEGYNGDLESAEGPNSPTRNRNGNRNRHRRRSSSSAHSTSTQGYPMPRYQSDLPHVPLATIYSNTSTLSQFVDEPEELEMAVRTSIP